MRDYKYLIIGGGMTADAAVNGIRDVDGAGSIGVIGAEAHPPYNRPPLSKGLWTGMKLEKIWRRQKHSGVELHLGREGRAIDPRAKTVTDDRGEVYKFEKLLLATGGTPRRLPFGGGDIIYFRTVDEYQRVRALADQRQRFAVIGGGFIGSEIAASLATVGKQVTMAFPESAIGERVYPRDLAQFLNDYYRQKGVEVLTGENVVGLDKRGEQFALQLKSRDGSAQREVVADGVVAGIGITPNVELARAAGLPVGNGILVDETLHAGQPDIYAAGDVAAFHNPALGERIRVEHEDNANTQGSAAGCAMAGREEPYHHLPSFYSDLFDLGYEAVGELDARLETVADWKQQFREGVVYYLRHGRVRGVLLWNVWGQVDAARALIAEPGPFRAADLMGRIAAKAA